MGEQPASRLNSVSRIIVANREVRHTHVTRSLRKGDSPVIKEGLHGISIEVFQEPREFVKEPSNLYTFTL